MLFFRRLGGLARNPVRSLRAHDPALYAAGVTFFAGIALVPTVLVAVWLAGRLVGPELVAELGRSLADALPDVLGAPHVAESTVEAGLGCRRWSPLQLHHGLGFGRQRSGRPGASVRLFRDGQARPALAPGGTRGRWRCSVGRRRRKAAPPSPSERRRPAILPAAIGAPTVMR